MKTPTKMKFHSQSDKQRKAGMFSQEILSMFFFLSIYCMPFFKFFFFNFGPNYSTTWNSSGTGNPRRDPNSSNYLEEDTSNDEFDDDDDENGEEQISISSRGRVRKISSKVRGYFRE